MHIAHFPRCPLRSRFHQRCCCARKRRYPCTHLHVLRGRVLVHGTKNVGVRDQLLMLCRGRWFLAQNKRSTEKRKTRGEVPPPAKCNPTMNKSEQHEALTRSIVPLIR
ncbi:unnamed protein product, partial [Ectocarpus sp. 8 AP-2014]